MPPVLIFCLQRFKSHGTYFKDKLEDNVTFPLEGLDLKPYVISHEDTSGKKVDLTYDLVAVSNHYGSLAYGHYTAYGKNHETGIWYDFNDSSVSQISPDETESTVVSSAAYVLYYIRRDFFPSSNINFDSIKVQLP